MSNTAFDIHYEIKIDIINITAASQWCRKEYGPISDTKVPQWHYNTYQTWPTKVYFYFRDFNRAMRFKLVWG
jgi:hypothetical protein